MECTVCIKEGMWGKFEENAERFGFVQEPDGYYRCTKKMFEDDDDLEIYFLVGPYSHEFEIVVEIQNIKSRGNGCSFEICPDNFEPLWRLGAEGYLDIK